MTNGPRDPFKKPNAFRRYLNRFPEYRRVATFLISTFVVINMPVIWRGLQAGQMLESRRRWIHYELRDLEKTPYSSYDREIKPERVT